MYSATHECDKSSPSTSEQPCRRFSLAEIQSATNNFDEKLIIGEGGFGKVYKGRITIEETSHFVAIKRLDCRSDQGASEFRAEIEMLSKLRHCHLVSLYGFCDVKKEMILVYEYMPHGTLYDHLHKAATPLTWVQRLKIGIGAGRGLDYLHTGFGTHQGVIHRDVKSSNILLDENLEAMISDFGLSKIGPTNQSLSYIEASVKGTFGYLDLEYFYTKKLTRKSDVYSFGVVLFELLSGRLPVDTKYGDEYCSLVRWAQKCVKERKVDQMVDSNMSGISPKCVRQFAQIAYPCLSSVPKDRPTMTEVVASLQALLKVHKKLEVSAYSSSTTGITSKMHRYFGFSPKLNSPKLNTDRVGMTSKSAGENMTTKDADHGHQEKPRRYMEMNLVPPSPGRFSLSPKLDTIESVHWTMSQVTKATRNFSPSLRLGEGGFGTVYKAQLNEGHVVAIKRAKKECYDAIKSEFRSEVNLFEKTDHRNIVKLVGYVDEGNEHLLITEYMPNGTLRQHLDGVDGSFLDFSQRLSICIDIAHGLTYLHLYAEYQIIHRDIKSSNILLNERLTAKVTDFGFARLENTTSGRIKGTLGYIDPEYMRTNQLTTKCDVYSFGVLLIEILTGRRPIQPNRSPEEKVTIRWAFEKFNEDHILDLVDPQLKESVDREIFENMLSLAFQCAAPSGAYRPDMKWVGERLWVYRTGYLNSRRGRQNFR